MVVAGDHRPPGADVVDVAVAVHVEQERALRALREERFAADRAERAYRLVHAARHQRLGAGEQGMRALLGHGRPLGGQWGRAKQACSARAAATGSGASKTPPITASRSAPASSGIAAFSGVIPPIATTGRPSTRASRSSAGPALRAPGLVPDGNMAPKAT